jgi:hypothetical protein
MRRWRRSAMISAVCVPCGLREQEASERRVQVIRHFWSLCAIHEEIYIWLSKEC